MVFPNVRLAPCVKLLVALLAPRLARPPTDLATRLPRALATVPTLRALLAAKRPARAVERLPKRDTLLVVRLTVLLAFFNVFL